MIRQFKLAVACSIVMTTGCAVNPGTGEYEINRAGIGIAIGTVAGAAAGAALGDGSYVVKGALIGAALGGATGAVLERQHEQLQKDLADTPLTIERTTDKQGKPALVVEAPADVTFAAGSADLASSAFSGLAKINSALAVDKPRVEIVGHADSTGRREINQLLSYSRAQSVAEFLRQSGYPADRIVVRGAGSSQPKATNESPEGRAANRRVQIVIHES